MGQGTWARDTLDELQHTFWSKAFSICCSRAEKRKLALKDAMRELAAALASVIECPKDVSNMSEDMHFSVVYLHACMSPEEQDVQMLKAAKQALEDKRNALFRPFRVHCLVHYVSVALS